MWRGECYQGFWTKYYLSKMFNSNCNCCEVEIFFKTRRARPLLHLALAEGSHLYLLPFFIYF